MPSLETNRKNFQAAKDQGNIVPAAPVENLRPPIPVATYPVAPNPNLRTPLPAISVQQPDQQRQWQTGATPQQRIPPPSQTGNPIAAAQTISNFIVLGAASAAPVTDIESIAINKQTGTAYTVTVNDLDTLVTFNNNSGGTIKLPSGTSRVSPGSSSYVQSAATDAYNVPTIVQAFSSNLTAGNTVVVFAASSVFDNIHDLLITSVTDSLGNLYTLYKNKALLVGGSQLVDVSMWVAKNVIGGACTVTGHADTAASPRFLMWTIMEYTASTIFAYDGETDAIATGSPRSATTPAITTTGVNDLIFGVAIHTTTVSNPLFSAGSGYTMRKTFFEGVLIGWAMGVEDRLTSSIGNYTASMSAGIVNSEFTLLELPVRLTTVPSQSFPAGWFTYIQNTGTGTFTLSSDVSIDGSASNVSIGPSQGLLVVFDGFNWYTERGIRLPLPIAVASGGTGDTTLTAHNVLLGEGTSPIAFAAPSLIGTILTSNGTPSDPTFQSPPGAVGTVLTSNGPGSVSTYQVLPAQTGTTVGSDILKGSNTVSNSADVRGLTIFAHIRGRDMLNAAQTWKTRFVFGTTQTAGNVVMSSARVYKMNQVNPSGALFGTYALSSVANAVGANTTYTGTNLGTLVPGSKINIAGFVTGANNGTAFTVVSSTATTLTLNNASGVSETHAATAQLSIIASDSSVTQPLTIVAVGGAQELVVGSFNTALDPQFDYVVAIYFKLADTSIPIIVGVADTLANDGNTLKGATFSGDGTLAAVAGVIPAFTNYPTALLMHQFQVIS